MSNFILRVLNPDDAEMLYRHYHALGPESKRCRFGLQISDYALRHFIDNMDLQREIHFAIIKDQDILALAQLSTYSNDSPVRCLELGISVADNARRQGYASLLWDAATTHARACNMQEIYVLHSPRNIAMVKFCCGKGLRLEDLHGERVGIWTNANWANMLHEEYPLAEQDQWPGILPQPTLLSPDEGLYQV